MKNVYLGLLAAMCMPFAAFADGSYTSGKNTETSVSGNVTVSGKTELHLTSKTSPIAAGSVINLVDDESWLMFDGIKPSKVRDNYLQFITVKGQPAVYNNTVVTNALNAPEGTVPSWNGDHFSDDTNVRLAEWGSGTVVIPNGFAYDDCALTVYDKSYCDGESKQFGVLDNWNFWEAQPEAEKFTGCYNDLGEWNNRIVSFKLKRGYMVTLANNPDGSGHSRVWIADEDDITVNILPEGFLTYTGGSSANRYDASKDESFVSYIRVFRWEWVSKKGWAGWSPYEITTSNADSYYVWGKGKVWKHTDGFDRADYEFVPIKQNGSAPKFSELDSITSVTHLLGYNEPDRPDQANVSVDFAISEWPNMLRTGYRLGSPAPSYVESANWLKNFFTYIDIYNYRCDFAVVHIYERRDSWVDRINSMTSVSNGRPSWVTEYNNGANWTSDGSYWPDGQGGATTKNFEKQRSWTAQLMPQLESIAKLERAYYYNWVQDCRMFIYNSQLTPAGEVFANFVSAPGYKATQAYDHTWKIAPVYLTCKADFAHEFINVTFYDHNGETAECTDIEQLTSNGWQVVKSVKAYEDYEPGTVVTVQVPYDLQGTTAFSFRSRAKSYKGDYSAYSPLFKVIEPTLGTTTVYNVQSGGEFIKIRWDAVEGAEDYNIKRGVSTDAIRTIEYHYTSEDNTYVDNTTKPKTRYYYQVEAYNQYAGKTTSKTLSIYSGESGIDNPAVDNVKISVENGNVIIESPYYCNMQAYTLDGRLVRDIAVVEGVNVVEGLAKGVYVINREKVVVR